MEGLNAWGVLFAKEGSCVEFEGNLWTWSNRFAREGGGVEARVDAGCVSRVCPDRAHKPGHASRRRHRRTYTVGDTRRQKRQNVQPDSNPGRRKRLCRDRILQGRIGVRPQHTAPGARRGHREPSPCKIYAENHFGAAARNASAAGTERQMSASCRQPPTKPP